MTEARRQSHSGPYLAPCFIIGVTEAFKDELGFWKAHVTEHKWSWCRLQVGGGDPREGGSENLTLTTYLI